jgi:hypothetical protein
LLLLLVNGLHVRLRRVAQRARVVCWFPLEFGVAAERAAVVMETLKVERLCRPPQPVKTRRLPRESPINEHLAIHCRRAPGALSHRDRLRRVRALKRR